MNITVNYFGQLADIAGVKKVSVSLEKATINDLLESIRNSEPRITEAVFAVFLNNKKVSDFNELLNPEDEVSLMPPFAGG